MFLPMTTDALKREIKQLLVESLNLPGVRPDEIDDDTPIFQNSLLGLDSIDALEIIVALQRKYGVHIDDQNLAREVLRSVSTIAAFVSARENPA